MKQVKPYSREESDKKTQVKRMFDRIAPSYDFLNHLLSLGIDRSWRRKAIATLNPGLTGKILDVATGTGDLAILSARKFPDSQIIGIDIAERMLDIAKRKAQKLSLDNRVSFLPGDAESLDFNDGRFSAVTVAFGIRNFGDLELGLAEMKRVLRDGGSLAILEFGKPTVFPLKQLYHFYFRNLLPLIGKITSRDPRAYRYLYESVQTFPEREAMKAILQEIGFNAVNYKSLTFGICILYTATG